MVEENKSIPTDTEIKVEDLPKESNPPSETEKTSPLKSKKILIGVIVLVLVFSSFLAGFLFVNQNQKNAILQKSAAINKEAYDASVKGDYKTAEKKYYEALKVTNGKDPQALAGLIKTISSQGNETGSESAAFEKAKPFVEIADKYYSNNPDILLATGYAYETAGKYNEALKYCTKVTKIAPKSDLGWFQCGHALQFLDKKLEAYEAYDRAYSLNPSNPLVLIVKGNRLIEENKLDEAYEVFMRATDISFPASIRAEAFSMASEVMRTKFELKKALELSQKAVDLAPDFSFALSSHGYNLAFNGKREEGRVYLEKSIEANLRSTINYNRLAQIQRAEKNFADAINNQKKAINLIENDNTIVGESEKKKKKGFYYYDLAKTYDMSKLSINIVQLLRESFSLNPEMKEYLKSDNRNGRFFSSYYSDKEFIELLK